MKSALFLFVFLFGLDLFGQKTLDCMVTYNRTGQINFNIPAEENFNSNMEFHIKCKKQSLASISFFKTSADSIFYFASVEYDGKPTLEDLMWEEVTPKIAVNPNFFKCTKENHPTFVIDRSGSYSITLEKGEVVKMYKLIIDLKPKEDYYDGKKPIRTKKS